MRRFTPLAAVLALLAVCSVAHANPRPTDTQCTVQQFRADAHAVYLPWDQPIHGYQRLRSLKRCAPNARTLAGMRKTERDFVSGRARAREKMLCGTPRCNRRLGRYKLRQRGELDQWPCLEPLWDHESGWDANAVNPSSGAAGIPQALGHGAVFGLGDAGPQIDWGLDYVDERYGSPCAAWSFWQSAGWY